MSTKINIDDKIGIEIQKSYDDQLRTYLTQIRDFIIGHEMSKADIAALLDDQIDELSQRIAVVETRLII